MSNFIFNPLHSEELQLYPEAGEFDSRYLLLDQTTPQIITDGAPIFDGGLKTRVINAKDATGLSLFDDANNGIFVRDGGNVGIGTTAPGAKLDIAGAVRLGDAGGTYDILNTSAAGGAASGDLYWGNSALLTSANIGSFGVSSVTNSDGTLNISPTTGDVVASLNLANANTWTAAQDIQLDSSTAFAVRNSGGTGLLAMNTNTGLLSLQGLQSTATLGSELVTNGSFDTDLTGWTYGGGSDWTWDASGKALHATGNTTPFTQDITTTNGTTYQVTVTTTRTAGYVSLSFGDTEGSYNLYSSTYTYTFRANGASETLTFTPSSDFNGTVDSISVKAITANSSPVLAVNNSDGSVGLELRSGGAGLYNSFLGAWAGRNNTTGNYNSFLGTQAGLNNTTGSNNSFLGYAAGYSNTTGYNNSFLGYAAGYSNTTGYYNSFLGMQAGYDVTEGFSNTLLGYNTGRGITTGDKNTIVGANVTGLAADLSNNIILADGAGNVRLQVDGSGNVGIGTTNPLFGKLEIYGNGSDTRLAIHEDAGTNIAGLSLRSGTRDWYIDSQEGVDFRIYRDTESPYLTIKETGNVGIGTTSPSTKLDIGAGAMTLEAMTAPSSPASDKAVLFLEATGTSPSRTVALKVKWEDGSTSTLASVTV